MRDSKGRFISPNSSTATAGLKEGDRVRRTSVTPGATLPGTLGTVVGVSPYSFDPISVRWDGMGSDRMMRPEQVERVEEAKPAPEPEVVTVPILQGYDPRKVVGSVTIQKDAFPNSDYILAPGGKVLEIDEQDRIMKSELTSFAPMDVGDHVAMGGKPGRPGMAQMAAAGVNEIAKMAGELQDALGMPGTGWPEMVQAVARLKAEVAKAQAEFKAQTEARTGDTLAFMADIANLEHEREQVGFDRQAAYARAEHAERERAAEAARGTLTRKELGEAKAKITALANLVRAAHLLLAIQHSSTSLGGALARILAR